MRGAAGVLVLSLAVGGCFQSHRAAVEPIVDAGGIDAGVARRTDAGTDAGADSGPVSRMDAGPLDAGAPLLDAHAPLDGVLDCGGGRVVVELSEPFPETFTIELWVRPTRAPARSERLPLVLAEVPWSDEPIAEIVLVGGAEGPTLISIARSSAGGGRGRAEAWPAIGEWTHTALAGTNGYQRVLVSLDGRTTGGGDAPPDDIYGIAVRPTTLTLCAGDVEGSSPLEGQLDQLRVSRVERYDGDYVPDPSLERDPETFLLLDFDDGVTGDRTGRHEVRYIGDVTIVSGSPAD